MTKERYPGEQRGLSRFLTDLLPAVEQHCGRQAILGHAIRRALRSGDLAHLRHARRIFNHLPREERSDLAAAIVRRASSATAPEPHELLDAYSQRQPEAFVSFESSSDAPGSMPVAVTLTHELLPASTVRVMISPGTLPRTAAEALRRIAAAIENDRRLLSKRYWHGQAGEPTSRAGE